MTCTEEVPQIELELNVEQDDLFSHSKQRISKTGRIQVSNRAWVIRSLMLVGLVGFMIYNVDIALSIGDPLIVYSTLMPIHAILLLVIGWVFYKHKPSKEPPDDLVSVIIPIYNQENLIEKVINAIYGST
jgi:hyaluronan synthase